MVRENIKKRIVDIHAYMPVCKELLEQGRSISITITGNSMQPFLAHGRDQIIIEKPMRDLKKGDMAFYQRINGEYVMHRICRVENQTSFWFVGDAQIAKEGPIGRNQIFGLITAVKRKEKWIYPGMFCWEFYRIVWLNMFPLRRLYFRMYRMIGRLKIGRNDK